MTGMSILAHPWAATALEQRATVFLRSRLNCPLPRMLAGPRLRPGEKTDEAAHCQDSIFSMHSSGLLRDRPRWLFGKGWHTMPLSPSLPLPDFGRRELPSSSRLSFPGGSTSSHSGPSSEAWLQEGLGSGAGLSLSHQI